MKARDDPEYGKLFTVRPFVDSMKSNFPEIQVEEYNSVDELIIALKGRSSPKQYVRNKPPQMGNKIFARAGSSGIVETLCCVLLMDSLKGKIIKCS